MSKENICLIGLSNQFVDKYAIGLSKKLELYYANTDKIIQFELFDIAKMEETCGKEYLEKKETSILKRLCTYEDTLLSVEYQLLNNETNYKILKENCIIIYLKISATRYKSELQLESMTDSAKILNIDLFKDRDYICTKKADIVVNCKDLQENYLIDEILHELIKYVDKK